MFWFLTPFYCISHLFYLQLYAYRKCLLHFIQRKISSVFVYVSLRGLTNVLHAFYVWSFCCCLKHDIIQRYCIHTFKDLILNNIVFERLHIRILIHTKTKYAKMEQKFFFKNFCVWQWVAVGGRILNSFEHFKLTQIL